MLLVRVVHAVVVNWACGCRHGPLPGHPLFVLSYTGTDLDIQNAMGSSYDAYHCFVGTRGLAPMNSNLPLQCISFLHLKETDGCLG